MSAAAEVVYEPDRRCPNCDTWLDRYGNCPQCREPDGEFDETQFALPEEGR